MPPQLLSKPTEMSCLQFGLRYNRAGVSEAADIIHELTTRQATQLGRLA
jgi:hypothetical protein